MIQDQIEGLSLNPSRANQKVAAKRKEAVGFDFHYGRYFLKIKCLASKIVVLLHNYNCSTPTCYDWLTTAKHSLVLTLCKYNMHRYLEWFMVLDSHKASLLSARICLAGSWEGTLSSRLASRKSQVNHYTTVAF